MELRFKGSKAKGGRKRELMSVDEERKLMICLEDKAKGKIF